MPDEAHRLGDRPASEVPLALARLHRARAPGARVTVELAATHPLPLAHLITGAGFEVVGRRPRRSDGTHTTVDLLRLRTLADTVGAGMKLLVCGINPSLHAADRGVGYAGPGNRFWPAAIRAGLVTEPGDALAALCEHRIGMTDLAKRATPRAAAVTAEEHRAGVERVRALVRWLQPEVVCVVGLDGWRQAVDPRTTPGLQPDLLAGRPVHVMPSTSGLNTRSSLDELTDHLRAAARLVADRPTTRYGPRGESTA